MTELIAIQSELKAPKAQYNKFGGYNYRRLEDILEAVKPLLKKHECELTFDDVITEIVVWEGRGLTILSRPGGNGEDLPSGE